MQPTEADYHLSTSPSGALTLRDNNTGEHLHRSFGPVHEPREVYAKGCNIDDRHGVVTVADVGMGAGFNVLAALHAASGNERLRHLCVHSFDTTAHGLAVLLKNKRAFAAPLGGDQWFPALETLLREGSARGKLPCSLVGRTFEWIFHPGDARHSIAQIHKNITFDAIFYDFFSWKSHPMLWTRQVLSHFATRLTRDGVFATYSSSTAIRAALLSLNLSVGEGPLVNTHLRATLASPQISQLSRPLTQRWLERFRRSQHPCLEVEDEETEKLIQEAVEKHPQFREAHSSFQE